jgi:hypothetical protein
MTGETIEVCQDCGYIIEPVTATAPWGDRYRITMCMRDECLLDRMAADSTAILRRDAAARLDSPRWDRRYIPLITNDPRAWFRVTGV